MSKTTKLILHDGYDYTVLNSSESYDFQTCLIYPQFHPFQVSLYVLYLWIESLSPPTYRRPFRVACGAGRVLLSACGLCGPRFLLRALGPHQARSRPAQYLIVLSL